MSAGLSHDKGQSPSVRRIGKQSTHQRNWRLPPPPGTPATEGQGAVVCSMANPTTSCSAYSVPQIGMAARLLQCCAATRLERVPLRGVAANCGVATLVGRHAQPVALGLQRVAGVGGTPGMMLNTLRPAQVLADLRSALRRCECTPHVAKSQLKCLLDFQTPTSSSNLKESRSFPAKSSQTFVWTTSAT